MAASSTMLELGTPLPSFSLLDTVSGNTVSSATLTGAPSVIAVLCNHCPYVKHLAADLTRFASDAIGRGFKVLGISANDVGSHPEDGPRAMAEEARRNGYPFPYLYDETQEVVKALRAACTPEFYVFDNRGRLAYRGRFDDSTPRNGLAPTGRDLTAAMDAVAAGRAPSTDQKPSIGCSIKWKPGNEPDYFG
jgi:peroxiredoxin